MSHEYNIETACTSNISSDNDDNDEVTDVYDSDDYNQNNKLIYTNISKRISDSRKLTSGTSLESSKSNTKYGSISGGGLLQRVYEFNDNVFVVRVTPDMSTWAVGLQSGKIQFHDCIERSEPEVKAFNVLKSAIEKYPVTDMEFIFFDNPKNKESKQFLLAAYASGYIRLWHFNSPNHRNRLIREWQEKFYYKEPGDEQPGDVNNQILCISVSMDSQRFVTGGDDQVLKIYEITSKSVLRILYKADQRLLQTGKASDAVLESSHHTMRITAVQYHPLGKTDPNYSHIFISASWDNTIQIWDDRNPQSLWQYHGPHVCGSDGLDINPEQNTIVTSSWKRDKAVLQIWKFNEHVLGSTTLDMRSIHSQYNVPISEYYQDNTQIPSQGYVAQFILNGQYIVFGGSNANLFKIVDAETFSPFVAMFNMKSAVVSSAIMFEKTQCLLALASGTNLIIIQIEIPGTSSFKKVGRPSVI